MVNYSQGKIYKIMVNSDPDRPVYVGSTCKQYLSQRMDNHRSQYKMWKEGKKNNVTVFDIFDKYGIDNCCIVLLELVSATTIDELHARERFWIQCTVCVNKVIPGRTNSEYYADNRDRILKQTTQYYADHREQLLQHNAQYRANNCEQISRQRGQYRADNREQISVKNLEKIQCECGCSVTRANMSRHTRTKKHLALVAQLNPLLCTINP